MNFLDLEDTQERRLGTCLRRQAEKIPDRDFIVWDRTHYGYGQANQLANAYARGFQGLGVSPGDTVSFLMETCPEYVFATLGLNKTGAVWVPTNVDYKGRWLQESFEDGGARVLVADAALLPRVAELPTLPFDHVVVRGSGDTPDLPVPSSRLEDLCATPGEEPDDAGIGSGDNPFWRRASRSRFSGRKADGLP